MYYVLTANLRNTLWPRLEFGHKHALFHVESQSSDGIMPNVDAERKTHTENVCNTSTIDIMK